MKKNILIILIGSFIFGLSIFGYFNLIEQGLIKSESNKIQNIKPEVTENKYNLTPQIGVKPLSGEDGNLVKVSLEVLGNRYDTQMKENSSVFDLMNKIKKENNNFYFKYKEYPSLGIFIEEINGIKDGSGKYWIYYINNKEASVGVSKYILKEGDSILWKQE